MKTTVIAMRIDESTSLLIKKLIKYNLADNSADALRFIMLKSLGVAREEVERREKAEKLLSVWQEKGFPELPADLSVQSMKERE